MEHIPIKNVLCDVEPRINEDMVGLSDSLKVYGQLEPLVVEGPDHNLNYFLVHGYRRLNAMKKLPELFPTVKCNVINDIPTSTQERNKLRFMIATTTKKHSGIEQQFMYSNIPDSPERKRLTPVYLRNKMLKGEAVPESERERAAKERKSFEALYLIYTIECTKNFREKLKTKYWVESSITCEEVCAIKKAINHELYTKLTIEQRQRVIEEVLRKAKFTKEKAGFLILQELMTDKTYNDIKKLNMSSWVKYICLKIDRINSLIKTDIVSLNKEKYKKEIELALAKITDNLASDVSSCQKDSTNEFNSINNEKLFKQYKKEKFIEYENYGGIKITFVYG